MSENWKGPLEKVDDFRWRIPVDYARGMRVPGLIYADEAMIGLVRNDQAPQQVVHVAHLPGILGESMAMPDIHWGYGFPIGGVAAMDMEEGVISPGGVVYDINCGVRLLRTNLIVEEVRPQLKALVERLFQNVPCGVGSGGKIRLSRADEKAVLTEGAAWAVRQGYGWESDTEFTEENGCMRDADPEALSERARERGSDQLGTLGSGNHFIEIQEVTGIFDPEAAAGFGLDKGRVVIMIHSGSRGLGYQVCDDNLERMVKAMGKYRIRLPDKQLACAPVGSAEGRQYAAGMAAAANYAWANRQLLAHWVRQTFQEVMGRDSRDMAMHQLYDVAHNIAKFEEHTVDGERRKVVVHRKGATRSFGPGHSEIPQRYRMLGQPVIIPGDMGTASYVLAGTARAMEQSFGSTCHGAGRRLSRHAAIRATEGRKIEMELGGKGIEVRSRGRQTLREEAPEAYKDIHHVVEIVHQAGLSRKVARMKPLAVIKG